MSSGDTSGWRFCQRQNTTRTTLHHTQQNNKRGTVQPLALFLITPLHDKLTENTLPSGDPTVPLLGGGLPHCGSPRQKAQHPKGRSLVGCLGVVCCVLCHQPHRGSGEAARGRAAAQGRAPQGFSLMWGLPCYDCGVTRREQRKHRDQREDGFSQ